MHWPSITTLAGELRLWNENTEFASEVFLNAWPSSDEWTIDAHQRRDAECSSHGYIPGYKHRFNARELARQLIDDAKESCGERQAIRNLNRVNDEFIRAGERERAHDPFFMQRPTDDYDPRDPLFVQPGSRYLHGLQGPSRRGGNLFPLYGEPSIDAEPEFDEPEEDDITTSDHHRWYQSGKLYFTGDGQGLRQRMDRDHYWPNVWFISDHGNAHIMSMDALLSGLGDGCRMVCPRRRR